MSMGLLFDCDEHVGAFIFGLYNQRPMKFDRALGIVDSHGKLVGGILFQCWNGANVEISYYGKKTLTPGIIRCLARFVILTFDVARVTATTSKRNKRHMRALQNLGFCLEGTQRRFYGARDCTRNTSVRFVMFREHLDKLARLDNRNATISTATGS